MIHTIIVPDPAVFRLITEQNETKKTPLANLPYEMYLHGKVRIIGAYDAPIEKVLASVIQELNPDTVFFLSESYPVSDEKLPGDIVLPNVFFSHNPESSVIPLPNPPPKGEGVYAHIPRPLFLEHYPIQGDYDFESFGLSVGGIHVSGEWDANSEDFRIQLRVAYENDTFDSLVYSFVEAAQQLYIQEKAYPVAYIGTQDKVAGARNLWGIVQFIIASIDPDSVSVQEEQKGEDGEWSDEEE